MKDKERIESLKSALTQNPAENQSVSKDDALFLLGFIERLERKNAVLAQQVLELTEEMENVRMDFGNNR